MARSRRDWQRWARRGSTEQRGYGHSHRQERERRLRVYRPGDMCAIGGEPMQWWPLAIARRFIDLPHDHANGGYLPGLACRFHNRQEGAVRGNRMRGQVRQWQQARQW